MKRVKMILEGSELTKEHIRILAVWLIRILEGEKEWDCNKLFNRQRTH